MDITIEYIERLLLSGLLGAVLGLEREWSGKSAGFRTLILVSIGSALFTIISLNMREPGMISGDRIASNIVTGIGFLGAGLIYKSNKGAKGLTTAATVWAAAAIGMAIGDGEYLLGVAGTVIIWSVLVVFFRLQIIFDRMIVTREYHITHDATSAPLDYKTYFKIKERRLLDSKHIKTLDGMVYIWTIRASKQIHDSALNVLLHDPAVKALEY